MEKLNNAIGPQVRLRSKNRPATVLVALGALLLGLQVATQYLAWQFEYQDQLGLHIGVIYPLWDSLIWYVDWRATYPAVFRAAFSMGVLTATIILIGLVLRKIVTANTAVPNPYLHGSARWATRKDIERAGLLGHDEGVYVGAWQDKQGTVHYLRHNGPEHVLTYAPTRSGKGVGLVIPTLLSWPQSAVIPDLKGELFAMTAGWRQQHANNLVLKFEPAATGSLLWNPLDEIRVGSEYEVGDVQNLATLIVDPDGKGLESHWQKTAQALLVGVILHVIYKARKEKTTASLPAVDALLADRNMDIAKVWLQMVNYPHYEDGQTHPTVATAAKDMMDRAPEEATSVLSTAKSYLALYRDPVVASNVSRSEFCIKDLMNHEKPVSLYIITQPNDKTRLRPLVRILMNMIVRLLADKMEFERITQQQQSRFKGFLRGIFYKKKQALSLVRTKKTYKHRLLMMMDEFPSLGKLEILQESLAFVAGYGIKFYLICQDINQLKSRETGYGADETITSNCHVQNAYPPNRVETAEHLSKLTGQTTVIKEQITTSGKRMSGLLSQVSRTMQEVQRPLLTVDECLRMPGPTKEGDQITEGGDMVIYVAGFPAIYGKQPLYFQDEVFLARASVPEPKASDKIR